MFAINHAATALVIKKCFPTMPMAAQISRLAGCLAAARMARRGL